MKKIVTKAGAVILSLAIVCGLCVAVASAAEKFGTYSRVTISKADRLITSFRNTSNSSRYGQLTVTNENGKVIGYHEGVIRSNQNMLDYQSASLTYLKARVQLYNSVATQSGSAESYTCTYRD